MLWDWVMVHPAALPAALCSDRPATGKMSPISVGSLGTGRSNSSLVVRVFYPDQVPDQIPLHRNPTWFSVSFESRVSSCSRRLVMPFAKKKLSRQKLQSSPYVVRQEVYGLYHI